MWHVYDNTGKIVKCVVGEQAAKRLRNKLWKETGIMHGFDFHSFEYR